MRISIEKEKWWVLKCLNTEIKGQSLNQVKEFKYLGSMFTEDGKTDREIEARIHEANTVLYQLAPLIQHPVIKHKANIKTVI